MNQKKYLIYTLIKINDSKANLCLHIIKQELSHEQKYYCVVSMYPIRCR